MTTAKLTRKPLTDEVWHNVQGQEFPEWLKNLVEPGAKPGQTFLMGSQSFGSRLVPSGFYVIKGPTDVYPCSPDGLKASYEIPEAPKHEPATVASDPGTQS